MHRLRRRAAPRAARGTHTPRIATGHPHDREGLAEVVRRRRRRRRRSAAAADTGDLPKQVTGQRGRSWMVEHKRRRQVQSGGCLQPVTQLDGRGRIQPKLLERSIREHRFGRGAAQHDRRLRTHQLEHATFACAVGDIPQTQRQGILREIVNGESTGTMLTRLPASVIADVKCACRGLHLCRGLHACRGLQTLATGGLPIHVHSGGVHVCVDQRKREALRAVLVTTLRADHRHTVCSSERRLGGFLQRDGQQWMRTDLDERAVRLLQETPGHRLELNGLALRAIPVLAVKPRCVQPLAGDGRVKRDVTGTGSERG